ncbi:CLUMA_CG009844, isoform A [Clunio marinus]|uniref:CLUMA_CG009844, isoform A n=1 Tax=Clunio marinus TaxID=568069 RepID=A0A1J1IA32_9DIPT|nr:CLUMA_CG009844, isoform A [Clunio marinus]
MISLQHYELLKKIRTGISRFAASMWDTKLSAFARQIILGFSLMCLLMFHKMDFHLERKKEKCRMKV